MKTRTCRLEPTLTPGKQWRVDVCTGNRKRGTLRCRQVTEAVYTLAQAQSFCGNNRAADYAHLLD